MDRSVATTVTGLEIASRRDQRTGGAADRSFGIFIHFSTDKQAVNVANAFYRGRNDLVLLHIDEAKLKPELKWEPPAGKPAPDISDSDLFPHIFGPINLTAVASILDFVPDPVSGTFSLPLFK